MLYLLSQTIDQAATRHPDAEAVCCAGQRMSYGELVMRANQLAHLLREQGVRRGDRVGLLMNKRLEAVVALYGIMKAGAAYVPLDPNAPVARIAFIVQDGGIRHLLTENAKAKAVQEMLNMGVSLHSVVGVDSQVEPRVACFSWDDVVAAPHHEPVVGVIEQDLAYILYTSGSTGVPKGVMHTHRSALSWAEIAAQTYGLHANDRVSNHAPFHFDLSTLDLFSTAVAGATMVIIPEMYTKLPASLSKLIEDEQMTVLYTVPFALIQLLLHGALDKRDLHRVRWVLFGGEPFPPKHLRALMAALPAARFCNVYGPTEVNGCTYYMIPASLPETDEPLPIGGTYGNAEALVVDAHDAPVAPGDVGELLIRSPTMMRGYWQRPDLDAKAFYHRPVFGHHVDVFHRTGDLVRERPEGGFDFLGRKDRQIKTRGYRVELDEVEAALLQHDDVEAAAVYGVPDEHGSQHIEAAVIGRPPALLEETVLVQHAKKLLPSYAVPERIKILDTFPRTSTGKIDRLALRAKALEGKDQHEEANKPPA